MDKDKKDFRYGQIPLCLLQLIWKEPRKALDLALSFSIVYRSKKLIPESLDEVAKQLVYDYHRGDLIPELKALYVKLEEENRLTVDLFPTDEMLFVSGGIYDPAFFENVVKVFNEHPKFEELAKQNWQIHTSAELLRVKTGSKAEILKGANVVQRYQEEQEELFGKQPMPMVNIDLLFKFRDNPENIELFTSYIAIKSIIGQRNFNVAHRNEVVRRMIGAKSNKALPTALEDPILKTVYQKYSKRYWWYKLVDQLLDGNFVKSKIGFGRRGHYQGIYFSTIYSYDELMEAIYEKVRLKNHKAQEKKALETLNSRLSNGIVTDNLNVTER
jgi:hypothetical protein